VRIPASLYVLVYRVNRHEASGVRSLVRARDWVIDYLDTLGDKLDAIAPLDLTGDDHPDFWEKLVQQPGPPPHHDRQIAGAVVELGREAWGATPHGLAHGAGADHRADDGSSLPNTQVGDPLYVREVLVAGWVVRDHVGQRSQAEIAEPGFYAWSHAGKPPHRLRPELGQG
jgi:hypothetical protein